MKEYPANKARSEGKHAGGALCIFKRALKTTAKYQQNKNLMIYNKQKKKKCREKGKNDKNQPRSNPESPATKSPYAKFTPNGEGRGEGNLSQKKSAKKPQKNQNRSQKKVQTNKPIGKKSHGK